MTYRLYALLLLILCCGTASAADPVVIGQTERIHSVVLNEGRTYYYPKHNDY